MAPRRQKENQLTNPVDVFPSPTPGTIVDSDEKEAAAVPVSRGTAARWASRDIISRDAAMVKVRFAWRAMKTHARS
jgi:hypothetical protein